MRRGDGDADGIDLRRLDEIAPVLEKSRHVQLARRGCSLARIAAGQRHHLTPFVAAKGRDMDLAPEPQSDHTDANRH